MTTRPAPTTDTVAIHRSMLHASPDGVVAIDEHGSILLVNHTLERMFGHSGDELQGTLLERLMPERFRPMHRAGLARFVTTGVKHLDWRRVEAVGLRADGTEFPLEIAFAETEIAGARAFLGYLRDVTVLAHARAELALATEVRESILACVEEGIMGADAAGFITFANPAACATLGFTTDELIGGYGTTSSTTGGPTGRRIPQGSARWDSRCAAVSPFTPRRRSSGGRMARASRWKSPPRHC